MDVYMDVYKVKKATLRGKVKISGAKNSILKLLAASLLTNDKIIITNFPKNLLDIIIKVKMLEMLGKKIQII